MLVFNNVFRSWEISIFLYFVLYNSSHLFKTISGVFRIKAMLPEKPSGIKVAFYFSFTVLSCFAKVKKVYTRACKLVAFQLVTATDVF